MAKKRTKFSQEIRQAVDSCGLTRYAICKALGMEQSLMSRFMAGAWLGKESMDALAELLNLHAVAGKVRLPSKKMAASKRTD
jgi:hypothetical protein